MHSPPRMGFLSTVPTNAAQLLDQVVAGAQQTGKLEGQSVIICTMISVLRLWTDFRGFFTILFDLIFTFYRTEIEQLRCTATSSRDFAKFIDRFQTISDT